MALSPSAKKTLDWALEKINKEGHFCWGFIVNDDQTDIQPFGNSTENVDDFIKNVESGVQVMKEAYHANNEA